MGMRWQFVSTIYVMCQLLRSSENTPPYPPNIGHNNRCGLPSLLPVLPYMRQKSHSVVLASGYTGV